MTAPSQPAGPKINVFDEAPGPGAGFRPAGPGPSQPGARLRKGVIPLTALYRGIALVAQSA